jgi:hypothetical protein
VPAAYLDYAGPGPALRARVLRQPGAWFLLRDSNPLRNQLHYYTGRPVAAPRIVGLARLDWGAFRTWLGTRLAAGDTVYTDALGGYQPYDRARLTLGDPAKWLLAGFPAQRVDSFPTFFGPRYLSLLSAPVGTSAVQTQPMLKASAAVKAGASR